MSSPTAISWKQEGSLKGKKNYQLEKLGHLLNAFRETRNKKPVILYKEWLITHLSAFELENDVYNIWFYLAGPVRAVLDWSGSAPKFAVTGVSNSTLIIIFF